MRNLIITAVLVAGSACSLYSGTERSQVSAPPDAGTSNDGCHNSLPDGGCCPQTLDGGQQTWPDGGPEDGGGYVIDAAYWDGGATRSSP